MLSWAKLVRNLIGWLIEGGDQVYQGLAQQLLRRGATQHAHSAAANLCVQIHVGRLKPESGHAICAH
jgi:hypothetical protein